ncbi:MAG: hypothetical protein MHM6MM_005215 [Cercozoa sp. M6MM]
MSAIHSINPEADVISRNHALTLNIGAANAMKALVSSNLGPSGTLKMLIGGAGQIKLTKDGSVLLREMQIQHPTASLIARTAVAQDDITGDGTTSSVIFTGELLRQAERYISEGLHPRVVVDGFDLARDHVVELLNEWKERFNFDVHGENVDREKLRAVARTSLATKLHSDLAELMTDAVVDAVLCIRRRDPRDESRFLPLDLFMIEVQSMKHRTDLDTRLVRGLVLDHGFRHPGMSKDNKKVFILTCNVSLEYEKTEVNSGIFYNSPEERERMVRAERMHVDNKVRQIIALKEQVCQGENEDCSFCVVNQKGVDPLSLDMLNRAGIVALRRAKRRNMERLQLACGGRAVNSLDNLTPEVLGYAEHVYEQVLGEDKFTFVEGCRHPHSCTLLVKGPTDHAIAQIKDALRDGERAIKNVLDDGCVIPGAGAFEIAAHQSLREFKRSLRGRAKIGVQAFADALLAIPKTLAQNAGHDAQETIVSLLDEAEDAPEDSPVGIDLTSGQISSPVDEGIWDNFCVKRQIVQLGAIIASKLLLVDEVIRAGRQMGK